MDQITSFIGVEFIYQGRNEEAECAITLEYMQKYGIEKVRGCCWSQVELRDLPQDLVAAYSRQCYECGYYGHLSNDCSNVSPSRSQSYQSAEPESESNSDSGFVEFCVSVVVTTIHMIIAKHHLRLIENS